MKITTSKLIRWAGLSAMAAGIIFTAIQPTHPSINTSTFIIITSFKTVHLHLWFARYYGALRQASGRNRLAGFGWLSSANHLLCSSDVHFIHRTHNPAVVDDHSADVCRKRVAVGKWDWCPSEPWQPHNSVFARIDTVCPRFSCLFGIAMFRARILPRGAAALLAISGPLAGTMFTLLPYQLGPVDIDTDGICHGLAGICALF